MEQLTALLMELEQITFQQISEIPTEQQHVIAEQIEILTRRHFISSKRHSRLTYA